MCYSGVARATVLVDWYLGFGCVVYVVVVVCWWLVACVLVVVCGLLGFVSLFMLSL